MVSPLKFYRKDPLRKGRGAGYYYKRSIDGKKWISKYSETRDANRKATTKISTKNWHYAHTGDVVLGKRHRIHGVTGKTKKTIFGWL